MIENKNISFDYDGTLDDHFDGAINPSKEMVRKILLELIKYNNVFIITKRFKNKFNEADKVYELANTLGINKDNIYFTNREMKIELIRKNNIDIHFEDDQYEVSLLGGICEVINVESDNWENKFIC